MAPPPKGVNPAPNHVATMNAIELLMASRPRRLLEASSLSAAKAKAAPSPLLARARAELQAGAHELAGGDDDNAGVGLRGPATAVELAQRRDARRLEARLLGKRRAVERATRRRRGLEPGSSDDEDDEPGRSAVGRGKKRPRVSREEEEEDKEKEEKEEGESNRNAAAAVASAEPAVQDRDAPKPDMAEVLPREPTAVKANLSESTADADPGEASQPKKKRKNKKKKKAAVLQTGADES